MKGKTFQITSCLTQGTYSPPDGNGETVDVAIKIPRLSFGCSGGSNATGGSASSTTTTTTTASASASSPGGGPGSFSSAAALRDFYLEAQITASFDHENILSCLGVSTDPSSGAPWLVFEFMPFGDLSEVLRSNSGVFSLQREDLPVLKMVRICGSSRSNRHEDCSINSERNCRAAATGTVAVATVATIAAATTSAAAATT